MSEAGCMRAQSTEQKAGQVSQQATWKPSAQFLLTICAAERAGGGFITRAELRTHCTYWLELRWNTDGAFILECWAMSTHSTATTYKFNLLSVSFAFMHPFPLSPELLHLPKQKFYPPETAVNQSPLFPRPDHHLSMFHLYEFDYPGNLL